jgi:hypothetical protein
VAGFHHRLPQALVVGISMVIDWVILWIEA